MTEQTMENLQPLFNKFIGEFSDITNAILLVKTTDNYAVMQYKGNIQDFVNLTAIGTHLRLSNEPTAQPTDQESEVPSADESLELTLDENVSVSE